MRRLFAILTLVSLLASYLVVFASPVSAAAGDDICILFRYTMRNDTASPASVTWTLYDFPATRSYSSTFTLQPGETQIIQMAEFFPASYANISALNTSTPTPLTFVGTVFFDHAPSSSVCNTGFGHIDDGRINAYDLGAPLAAYCTADSGIAVWDIDDTGHGTLAFTVTKADITKALSDAIASGHNVLVGQGMGDSLYALSSNQLTLTGPDIKEPAKTYEFPPPRTSAADLSVWVSARCSNVVNPDALKQ